MAAIVSFCLSLCIETHREHQIGVVVAADGRDDAGADRRSKFYGHFVSADYADQFHHILDVEGDDNVAAAVFDAHFLKHVADFGIGGDEQLLALDGELDAVVLALARHERRSGRIPRARRSAPF